MIAAKDFVLFSSVCVSLIPSFLFDEACSDSLNFGR